MLYSTLLRLWDREIEAIRKPMIDTSLPSVGPVLVHHVAPNANKMSMTFEVVLTPLGGIERWVRLFNHENQCMAFKMLPAEELTLVGTHRFQQGDDYYETRVLSMRD